MDTGTWLPGKRVLVAPEWIAAMSWADATVRVHLPRERMERSPTYDPSRPIDRDYETRLHDHYGRPPYWPRDRAA